jgi:8-oxo-dGTP pyrophosphatase MutT (NUDIX family)
LKNKIRQLVLLFSKRTIPVDVFSKKFPISIKGIIIHQNKVLLLKNERNEWDLPGGKIGSDHSAIDCLLREVKEETNLDVNVLNIVGTTIYNVLNWIKVFIVIYECELISPISDFQISGEHFDGRFFEWEEVTTLKMVEAYKLKIREVLNK